MNILISKPLEPGILRRLRNPLAQLGYLTVFNGDNLQVVQSANRSAMLNGKASFMSVPVQLRQDSDGRIVMVFQMSVLNAAVAVGLLGLIASAGMIFFNGPTQSGQIIGLGSAAVILAASVMFMTCIFSIKTDVKEVLKKLTS